MSYYSEVYRRRLFRYGDTPQERLDAGRELNFERFLKQSAHYVKFEYDLGSGVMAEIEAVLEPYRQTESKTLMNLLCRIGDVFHVGDIVTIPFKGINYRYMFYFWNERQDSGYNKWCLVKISQSITWKNEDGQSYTSEAYIYDQKDKSLKDDMESKSRNNSALYFENTKLAYLLMPATENLKINSYIELSVGNIMRSFKVTGFDFLSTPGILYVSMDPTPKMDFTPIPTMIETDDPADYFWAGKVTNGD